MARYELAAGAPGAESVSAFEHDSLEDWEDALQDLFAHSGGGVFSFQAPRRPAFTVIDAFGVLVKVAEAILPPDARIVATFGSDRAVENAIRMLPQTDRPQRGVQIGGISVEASLGDLTQVRADAIVNASNERLVLGGGVSDALRRAVPDAAALAGAMAARAPIAAGDVVETDSFGLSNVRLILHAATASGDPQDIRRAMANILSACGPLTLQTIAIPALGCGTGQLEVSSFATIAREAIEAHAQSRALLPRRVFFVLYDARAYAEFEASFTAV